MSRKRIFLFGTSLSKNSINRLFVEYTAKRLGNTKYTTTVTTVADYTNNLPVFSVEELAKGPNAQAQKFIQHLKEHDAYVFGLSENNFSYTAAFKNLLDWATRTESNWQNTFQQRQTLLLSVSPSPFGGSKVMESALFSFPILGAKVAANFSLPNYHSTFKDGEIVAADQKKLYDEALQKFTSSL